MQFKEIQERWNNEHEVAMRAADVRCKSRVKELVAQLENFKVTKLIMGMGDWVVNGEDYMAVYDDEEADTAVVELQELIYWIQGGGNGGARPKTATNAELRVLQELCELCDWWVDKTGGADVVFEAKS